MNYRAQLSQLNTTITHTADDETDAVLVKNGQETWVKIVTGSQDTTVKVVDKQAFKQTFIDIPATGDYAPLGHMPNYVAGTPKNENFDQDTFHVKDGDGSKEVTVQGGLYQVTYDLKEGTPEYTELEVLTNYINALKALGAQILYTYDDNEVDARMDKNGHAVWFRIELGATNVYLHVIEEKAFQATIKRVCRILCKRYLS